MRFRGEHLSITPSRRHAAVRDSKHKVRDCATDDLGELIASYSPDQFGWDTDAGGVLRVWFLKEEGGADRTHVEDAANPAQMSARIAALNRKHSERYKEAR